MTQSALQVWQEFMGSMQAGNDQWQKMLADDITFVGPAEQVKGRQDFIKLNQDFFKMVTGFDVHRHAAMDNTVASEATIKVSTPQGNELALDLAEFYNIENGKIHSVTIYYDPREFLKAFSM